MRMRSRLAHGWLLALLLAGIWTLPALGQGLTPHQAVTLERVQDVSITNDGSTVVFTRSQPADPREENETADTHLFALDMETGTTEPLYTETSVEHVALRPEQGTVTFLTTREEDENDEDKATAALYELPLDGGTPTRLLRHETDLLNYAWAPDGDRVAYTVHEDPDRPEASLPYEPNYYEEYVPHRRGYVQNVTRDGAEPQRLQVEGTIYILQWSPEGERLAITEAPTPHVDDYYMSQSVKIVAAETGEKIADIDNEGKIEQIQWSPDGERLALRAGADLHDPIAGRILIADAADDATPQNIYPGFEGKFEHIAWTGASTIHFLASESTERSFGTLRPDGSGFSRRLGPGGPVLTDFERTPDGTVAFVANTPRHPNEVYTMEPGAESPERRTTSNPGLADIELGEQRTVTYTARDGKYDIEGVLILPVGYEAGDEVPLIVTVHGGPEAHYSDGWVTRYADPGQMAAAQGYAVFYPNYRASTGRGVEFLKAGQADLAGKEFDDIVDGVDHLIDQGIADPDRVGVTGGSYGGYATAWMSTYYSPRFAAGVMNVGISNNISKWGTSDIPEELYLVHARERIWNSWTDMLKRSPIYHVDNAETPLLIADGEEDTRVHPSQSLEMYRHLTVRKQDLPVRLVMYPGEGHGYARATARYDFALRTMRWFDTYLKDDGPMPEGPLKVEMDRVPAQQ